MKYLKRRGPDGYRETKKKFAIHSRLGITNQNQPIENKDFYFYIMVKFIMIGKDIIKLRDAQYLDNFI